MGFQELLLEDCVRAQSKPWHRLWSLLSYVKSKLHRKRLTLLPRIYFDIILTYFKSTPDLCWQLHKLFTATLAAKKPATGTTRSKESLRGIKRI